MEQIPVCELKSQFLSIEPEIRAAIDRVLSRSWFILGQEGRSFEEELAAFLRVGHVVGLASGTDAIHLALRAVGIVHGDHVLTAPNSAVPTASGIAAAGAIPAFADVDPLTGLLDPASVERHLTPAVKAIVPVHLYGRCVPMGPILDLAARRGIPVVEDAAQAHGATWEGRAAGTIGTIGCFSFYPSKNLGAYGDGGACATADPGLARTLRALRNYGETSRYKSEILGFNSRLDELQAAVLRAKLPHLPRWNARRREICAAYRRGMGGLPLILPPADPEGTEAPHLFVVQVARRERARAELEKRGVGTQIHYPVPIHLHPAFADLGFGPDSFPVAESRARRILTLPLYPELSSAQVDAVIGAVTESLRGEPAPEQNP
jgi:dTDP-4-amino-4,6-dideoxygalactose transaminase